MAIDTNQKETPTKSEDNKDTSYLYYRNGAVKIKHNQLTLIDYLDLGGYVWKDHVIDRDFALCEHVECDYQKFIQNICGNNNAVSYTHLPLPTIYSV